MNCLLELTASSTLMEAVCVLERRRISLHLFFFLNLKPVKPTYA